MGLSNEERLLGALYTLRSLGHELDEEGYTYWRHSYSRVKKYVTDARAVVEQLVGLLIQQIETNKSYWLLGQDGFAGLTKDNLSLYPHSNSLDFLGALIEEHMDHDALEEVSLRQFAQHVGFTHYNGVEELLRWWELWEYIPAILYRVNRYEDDLFSKEFKYQLNRLLAQLQFLHKEIGVDGQVEEVMLVKFDIFQDWHKAHRGDKDCRWLTKADEIAAMSLQEVADWRFEKMRTEGDYASSENSEKSTKVDPVYGTVKTVDSVVAEVAKHFKAPYPSRADILDSLNRMKGDVKKAVSSVRAKQAAERRKEKK